jgi:hypothetical protein
VVRTFGRLFAKDERMTVSSLQRISIPRGWRWLLALSVAAMLVACGDSPSALPDDAGDSHAADEQAVFAAVLAQEYGASSYVIYDHTMACSPDDSEFTDALAYVDAQMPELAAETVASFAVRSATSHALSANMDLGAPYTLVSDAQMQAIFSSSRDGWQLFYEKYPDAPGTMLLSRVGFNATGDQALVSWRLQWQWLAGDGGFLLLTKVAGAWQVVRRVVTIVS